MRVGYGFVRRQMTAGLGLNDKVAHQGLALIEAEFDKVEALLADGRKYLAQDRLTVADLAFATSGAPVVLARGYGGHLPKIEQLPEKLQRTVRIFRDRPAGAFIQRLYDEHR